MKTGYMQKPTICKDSLGSHYYILHCFESGYMQKPDICKNFAGSRAFAYTRILLYMFFKIMINKTVVYVPIPPSTMVTFFSVPYSVFSISIRLLLSSNSNNSKSSEYVQ